MKKKFIVITSILFLLPCTSFASDQCSDILAQGIRDHYNFTSRESLENQVYTAVCRKSFNSRNQKSQFSLNIPIPQLNGILGFGDNSSSAFQRRVDFCNNANSKISRSAAVEFTKNTINQEVIAAWKSCMSSRGLYCEAENINDSHFRIKVSWDPSLKAPEPTITSDLRIIGGSCEKVQLLKKEGTIRQFAPVTEVCERNSDDQAFAYLNTDQGSVECYIPKIIRPLKPEEYLNACIEGDHDGCIGLKIEAEKKYNECMDRIGQSSSKPSTEQSRRECSSERNAVQNIIILSNEAWENCSKYGEGSSQCISARNNLQQNMRSNSISHRNRRF